MKFPNLTEPLLIVSFFVVLILFYKDPNDKKHSTANTNAAEAIMTLETGTVEIIFYPKDAPDTVKRIKQLIQQGFYNGLIFHRVVPRFVVQTGDPTGVGNGGSGQTIKAEFNSRKHLKGVLSMARADDPNSADSQFTIMLENQPHLDGQYTAFGEVIRGFKNVEDIRKGDKILKFELVGSNY